MKPNIIIEGCDRLGKDTLIGGLMHALGYFQLIHYQKPLELDYYDCSKSAYQEASFEQMFRMLSVGGMMLNRAHLGEYVYADRYRGYSGSYVFDMEDRHYVACKSSLLVLLYASSWEPITDDGLSFDFDKKEDEQNDFKTAFATSSIRTKLMVDVTANGQFRPRSEILGQVIQAYRGLKLELGA